MAYVAGAHQGTVRISVIGPHGHAREHIRIQSDEHRCSVNEVALGSEGLAVAGHCADPSGRRDRGFFLLRGPSGIRVVHTLRPLEHIVDSGDTFVVGDSAAALYRCDALCRRLPVRPRSVARLAHYGGEAVVIEEDGAVRSLAGSVRVESPGWNLPISRVVQTGGETVALFGPEITGSEFHPFCVRSIVARLGDGDAMWSPVHAVQSDEGRRLDCQSEQDDPAVVLDIAEARGLLFARRRHVTRGDTTFVPFRSETGYIRLD